MPKGQPNDPASMSRSHSPYPSLSSTQNGQLGVSERTEAWISRPPASQCCTEEVVQPGLSSGMLVLEPLMCSSSYDPSQAPFAPFEEVSVFPHSGSSGWVEFSSPPYPGFPINAPNGAASQPPPQPAPMDCVAPPRFPSQRPARGNPAATNIGLISPVYRGYARPPRSYHPYNPLGMGSVLTRSHSSSEWMQYPQIHPSMPCLAPHLMLPVDNSTFQTHQSHRENCTMDSSYSTAIPTFGIEAFRPPQSFSVPNPCEMSTSTRGPTSFLSGASGFRMRDIHYIEASHITVNSGTGTSDRPTDGWELLLKNTAPNALYNSSARYDAPKCDEDTRVEVTSEIMGWIKDRESPQRLLCMTGAAGAGKSALQQTVAEMCGKGDILACSFFFSATDSSRNTLNAFTSTIAYQLGRRNPGLKRWMKHAVEDDPLVFSQSLQAQMDTLIVGPFKRFREMEMNVDLGELPYAILIDGLDECKGEDCQAELLTAIRRCLLANDLPFRIFVASRPEWAIRTALQTSGHLHTLAYHIQLSDHYDAMEDMRRYLRRRFLDIGLRIGNLQWFTEDDVQTLVEAASGQFVYVATVFKYISERRASPVHRLKTVLHWTPHNGQTARPFEALDILYINILLAAKAAYEGIDTHSGHDFVFLVRILQMDASFQLVPGSGRTPLDTLTLLLSLESDAVELLISDLRSIVTLERDDETRLILRLYHKSFADFLDEESRAKDLYVPVERVWGHFAKCCMRIIAECELDFDCFPDKWQDLPLPRTQKDALLESLENLPFILDYDLDDDVVEFTQKNGWDKVDKLLPLLCQWTENVFSRSWNSALGEFIDNFQCRNPEAAEALSKFHEKWGRDIELWDRQEVLEWLHEMKGS